MKEELTNKKNTHSTISLQWLHIEYLEKYQAIIKIAP